MNDAYNEHMMQSPRPAEIRNLMKSVGIELQQSIKLEKGDEQSETSVTVLDEYLKSLGIA